MGRPYWVALTMFLCHRARARFPAFQEDLLHLFYLGGKARVYGAGGGIEDAAAAFDARVLDDFDFLDLGAHGQPEGLAHFHGLHVRGTDPNRDGVGLGRFGDGGLDDVERDVAVHGGLATDDFLDGLEDDFERLALAFVQDRVLLRFKTFQDLRDFSLHPADGFLHFGLARRAPFGASIFL